MELDGTDLAFVSPADERECQALCEPRLAGTRRASDILMRIMAN